MKKGRVSTGSVVLRRPVRAGAAVVGEELGSLYRLLGGEDKAGSEFAPVAQLLKGPSGGQGVGGAFGSEGLVAAEHVPDRFGQSAGEVDLGDLGAALLADASLGLLVAVAIHRRRAGVGGGLDQCPAEILGPLFGERAAQVAFA